MKIRFTTNLDNYSRFHFPEDLTFVPRKGEKVHVKDEYKSFYHKLQLPSCLEVIEVNYFEDCIICELWYSEIDIEKLRIQNKV